MAENNENKMNTWIIILAFISTILVIALRFTVPGHDLSQTGTIKALIYIIAGFAIAGDTFACLDSPVSRWLKLLFFIFATAIVAIFFFVEKLNSWPAIYEASAHLWVGAMITVGIFSYFGTIKISPRIIWIFLGIATAIETAKFFTR